MKRSLPSSNGLNTMGSIFGLGVLISCSSCGTDFLATLASGVIDVTGSGKSGKILAQHKYVVDRPLSVPILRYFCTYALTAICYMQAKRSTNFYYRIHVKILSECGHSDLLDRTLVLSLLRCLNTQCGFLHPPGWFSQ